MDAKTYDYLAIGHGEDPAILWIYTGGQFKAVLAPSYLKTDDSHSLFFNRYFWNFHGRYCPRQHCSSIACDYGSERQFEDVAEKVRKLFGCPVFGHYHRGRECWFWDDGIWIKTR